MDLIPIRGRTPINRSQGKIDRPEFARPVAAEAAQAKVGTLGMLNTSTCSEPSFIILPPTTKRASGDELSGHSVRPHRELGLFRVFSIGGFRGRAATPILPTTSPTRPNSHAYLLGSISRITSMHNPSTGNRVCDEEAGTMLYLKVHVLLFVSFVLASDRRPVTQDLPPPLNSHPAPRT